MTVPPSRSARRASQRERRPSLARAPQDGRRAHAARAPREGRRAKPARAPRAGRNLPAAIAVGLLMGGVLVASLLVVKEAYVVVVTIACVLGVVELRRSLAAGKVNIPLFPVAVAAALFPYIGYRYGAGKLTGAFLVACAAVLLLRGAAGLAGSARDAAGGVLAVAYVPLLASFTTLMLAHPDGPQRVLTFIIVGVASDIGGYAVGVLFGRHPMAPSASPKKSWEGFIGSATTCIITAGVCALLLLHAAPWVGVALGAVTVVAATLGDLVESILKRDLGIKDMGHLLPGHGGIMDRLDSLLLAAPVAWALTELLLRSNA